MTLPGYRPQTRWCGPHPWAPQAVEPSASRRPRRPVERGRRDVLLDLLEQSLRKGHWRVAVRRFLMLAACGFEVPADQRSRCEAYLRDCPARDLQKMRSDVGAWQQCVSGIPRHRGWQ
jgi:hypothetical protein